MPRSATGTWTAEAGFTLLEVLVTLALIGILTGVALLSVGGFSGVDHQLEREAQRLQARIEHHRDEAVLLGQTRGLRLTLDRYRLLRYDGNGNWQALDDGHVLPSGLELQLRVDGRSVILDLEPDGPPQIRLTASGEISPFRIELHGPQDTGYRLSADLSGTVHRETRP